MDMVCVVRRSILLGLLLGLALVLVANVTYSMFVLCFDNANCTRIGLWWKTGSHGDTLIVGRKRVLQASAALTLLLLFLSLITCALMEVRPAQFSLHQLRCGVVTLCGFGAFFAVTFFGIASIEYGNLRTAFRDMEDNAEVRLGYGFGFMVAAFVVNLFGAFGHALLCTCNGGLPYDMQRNESATDTGNPGPV